MNISLTKKIFDFYKSGGEIFYLLRTDDYTGWIPIFIEDTNPIGDLKGGIIYQSLSDHGRANVFQYLLKCDWNDFKFYKPIDLLRKEEEMNRMYLVIGDWSDDGHGKYEKILVEVNKTAKEVQNAYKASCKLTGISFNGNDDYTESGRDWEEAAKFQIAVEYEDSKLTEEVLEILNKFKCPKEIIENYTEEAYIHTYVPLWFGL